MTRNAERATFYIQSFPCRTSDTICVFVDSPAQSGAREDHMNTEVHKMLDGRGSGSVLLVEGIMSD